MQRQIGDSRVMPCDIVSVSADAEIAVGAEQPADLPGFLVVIDAQPRLVLPHAFSHSAFAYCAATVLRFMHPRVTAGRQVKPVIQIHVAKVFWAFGVTLLVIFFPRVFRFAPRIAMGSVCHTQRFTPTRQASCFGDAPRRPTRLVRIIAINRKLIERLFHAALVANSHSENIPRYAIAYQGVFT
jgi:hypothetical protein